jgi:hypothetical protein
MRMNRLRTVDCGQQCDSTVLQYRPHALWTAQFYTTWTVQYKGPDHGTTVLIVQWYSTDQKCYGQQRTWALGHCNAVQSMGTVDSEVLKL